MIADVTESYGSPINLRGVDAQCLGLLLINTWRNLWFGYYWLYYCLGYPFFYWPKNTGYNLHCSSADPDWLDTGRYLGGVRIEPIQH